jgi:hypothetical protein
MFNTTFVNLKAILACTLALLAVGASLFIFQIPSAHAEVTSASPTQTTTAKPASISDLQALIAKLQAQLNDFRANTSGLSFVNKDTSGTVRDRITLPKRSTDTTFYTVVSGLKASVTFALSNGCSGYVISWGDDTTTKLAGSPVGSRCTMAIVNVSKEHTYAKAGTYTVKVERLNGSRVRDVSTKEIKVGADVKPATLVTPVITQFIARPSNISKGQSATLSWKVNNANRCVIQGGTQEYNVPAEGRLMILAVTPTQTTVYKLWCVNDPGTGKDGPSADKTVTVTVKDLAPNKATSTSDTAASFTLTDIKSVTKQDVDRTPQAADSKYTLYTITLKNGRVEQVKLGGLITLSMVEAEFRKTGFTGSVSNLLAQATVVSTATPTGSGGSASTTTRPGSVRGASTDIYSEIYMTLSNIRNLLGTLK